MSDNLRTVEAMLNSLEPRQVDPVEVRQEDGEAANNVLYCALNFDAEGRFKLDMEAVARAFARHRIAAERRGAEAAIEAAEVFQLAYDGSDYQAGRADAARDILEAMRALYPATVAREG